MHLSVERRSVISAEDLIPRTAELTVRYDILEGFRVVILGVDIVEICVRCLTHLRLVAVRRIAHLRSGRRTLPWKTYHL